MGKLALSKIRVLIDVKVPQMTPNAVKRRYAKQL